MIKIDLKQLGCVENSVKLRENVKFDGFISILGQKFTSLTLPVRNIFLNATQNFQKLSAL